MPCPPREGTFVGDSVHLDAGEHERVHRARVEDPARADVLADLLRGQPAAPLDRLLGVRRCLAARLELGDDHRLAVEEEHRVGVHGVEEDLDDLDPQPGLLARLAHRDAPDELFVVEPELEVLAIDQASGQLPRDRTGVTVHESAPERVEGEQSRVAQPISPGERLCETRAVGPVLIDERDATLRVARHDHGTGCLDDVGLFVPPALKDRSRSGPSHGGWNETPGDRGSAPSPRGPGVQP